MLAEGRFPREIDRPVADLDASDGIRQMAILAGNEGTGVLPFQI
jgi:hypothetical protein